MNMNNLINGRETEIRASIGGQPIPMTEKLQRELEQAKKNCKFNLVRAIRSINDKQSFQAPEQRAIDFGMENARNMGITTGGQIVLPLQQRNVIDTSTASATIGTEVLNILEPLRNNLIFEKLGARFHTGLRSQIQVPDYSDTS
jgi:hypothetical protein